MNLLNDVIIVLKDSDTVDYSKHHPSDAASLSIGALYNVFKQIFPDRPMYDLDDLIWRSAQIGGCSAELALLPPHPERKAFVWAVLSTGIANHEEREALEKTFLFRIGEVAYSLYLENADIEIISTLVATEKVRTEYAINNFVLARIIMDDKTRQAFFGMLSSIKPRHLKAVR